MRKKIIFLVLIILLLGSGLILSKRGGNPSGPEAKAKPGQPKAVSLSAEETGKYTIDNQSSIYYIVNKARALPSTFVPQNLATVGSEQMRSDTANAVNDLISAARSDGIYLKIISGYRAYDYQARVYNDYVRKDGQAKADTYSARPGHSEHQTGLAVDIGSGTCDLQACFGDTKAGKWLAGHAYEYGFIIRYQKGKENLTGYQYEPWHIRYVGIDLAGKIYQSGRTMEQFFGLAPALNY